MAKVLIGRRSFSMDRQGRTFADVLHDAEHPFDLVIAFLTTKADNVVWRSRKQIMIGHHWRVLSVS